MTIEEIRKTLDELKQTHSSYFEYEIGPFTVLIFTDEVLEHKNITNDNILNYDTVNVNLCEQKRLVSRYPDGSAVYVPSPVSLVKDPRFRNYQPIKYTELIAQSNGQNMTIDALCELIKYLYKLNNLSAFT